MPAPAHQADRVVDHHGAAPGKDVAERHALRPADEDVRQVPERDQPLAAGELRVEDRRVQRVGLGLAVEPAEPRHARAPCRRSARRLRSMISPQMARMVPLAIGSRISTLSFQRGREHVVPVAAAPRPGAPARLLKAITAGVRYAGIVEVVRPDAARPDVVGPGRPVRREQRVVHAAVEDRGRPAEPDVGLRVHPLEAQPVEDLLRSHVEPAHVDVGMPPLEGVLQQGELVAAVGRVEHDRRARRRSRRTGGRRARGRSSARRMAAARAAHGRHAATAARPHRLAVRRQREQVREQPERPRHAGRQLPEEAEPGVDVGALPHRGDQQPALERRLARVVGLEQRPVAPDPSFARSRARAPGSTLPVGVVRRLRFGRANDRIAPARGSATGAALVGRRGRGHRRADRA